MLEKRQQELIDNENKTFAETVDRSQYPNLRKNLGVDPVPFKIAGDNKFKAKKWDALLKDCAFYYDRPTIEDESRMKKSLMTKYDDLFPGVAMKPVLQSRRDLLTWACGSQNSYMAAKDAPAEHVVDCTRYQALLDKYGPDYTNIRNRLGHIRGLFD